MSAPTKEYLLTKANMCRNLALTQIDAGEGEKAAENLMRMVKALGEARIIIEREDKEMGECDKCDTAYELSSRDNRCGDCGNCSGCCTHKREGENK